MPNTPHTSKNPAVSQTSFPPTLNQTNIVPNKTTNNNHYHNHKTFQSKAITQANRISKISRSNRWENSCKEQQCCWTLTSKNLKSLRKRMSFWKRKTYSSENVFMMITVAGKMLIEKGVLLVIWEIMAMLDLTIRGTIWISDLINLWWPKSI